jgi:uncharacterized protein YqhQ
MQLAIRAKFVSYISSIDIGLISIVFSICLIILIPIIFKQTFNNFTFAKISNLPYIFVLYSYIPHLDNLS